MKKDMYLISLLLPYLIHQHNNLNYVYIMLNLLLNLGKNLLPIQNMPTQLFFLLKMWSL